MNDNEVVSQRIDSDYIAAYLNELDSHSSEWEDWLDKFSEAELIQFGVDI